MRILGTGGVAPSKTLTNDDLSHMVETSDEWIRSRTGIVSRHIAQEEDSTFSLALAAARRAMDAACEQGVRPEQIGLVICATTSNEYHCPSLACLLQRDLGLRNDLLAYDLNAACSGFMYAFITASQLISKDNYALVVGSEVLSRLTDFTDRNTCVLFGDGAGAVVMAPSLDGSPFYWAAESRGDDDALSITDYIHMDGQAVFKFAVEALIGNIRSVAAKAQMALENVDHFICHQANERIIASAAKRLGLPLERFFMNLAHYGNTSAASIPLALDEALGARLIHPGNTIIMAGFGGGLTAGAACFTWE